MTLNVQMRVVERPEFESVLRWKMKFVVAVPLFQKHLQKPKSKKTLEKGLWSVFSEPIGQQLTCPSLKPAGLPS